MNNQTFKIDDNVIGGDKVFVIAEIGNNHNGSFDLAKQLVDASLEAGVDCVKFQIRNLDDLYRFSEYKNISEDLGVEYIQDLLKKVELSVEDHQALRKYCYEKNILYMCTPWDEASVEVLAGFNVDAIKIASADLCNPYLIEKASKLKKPIILSTGMSYDFEIQRAVDRLNELGVDFALLHCNSTYPAPESDIHLNYIKELNKIHPIIGYSGHERGIAISLAAVALGAKIIERHITFDRAMEGPDHLASLEPEEFKQLVDGIRQIEKALQLDGTRRLPSQGELLNRENLSKSVVAATDITFGQVFDRSVLRVASPGQGLAPYRLEDLIGKSSIREIKKGSFLFESDLSPAQELDHKYKFSIKWGVPVRYHDFREYSKKLNADLFEFHLSYRDLNKEPADYLHSVECSRLVVHAPELFENSELLDLAADDLEYRIRSIENLRKIVVATEKISQFFPMADSRIIVANIGGFSADNPKPENDRKELYGRISESLSQIDFLSTELAIQNMAPFPWHFGGQRFQNIFMVPDEIIEQSIKSNSKICLDLSHLQLTCNYFKLNFQDSLAKLLTVTSHLHIGDATGDNGEGIKIGQGDIDWSVTWKKICKYPDVSFIPEVWQGHKDHGAGFWDALKFLSSLPK